MASAEHGSGQPGRAEDIRLLIDTIPVSVWLTRPDGSAEFFNQRWLEYTGLPREQALDWGWKVAIHPEDLPRMLETFQEALNLRRSFEVEGRFRRWDGEFRWFLFRGARCFIDRETLSNGMERIPISKTESAWKRSCNEAKQICLRRRE